MIAMNFDWAAYVKMYYDMGLYNKEDVKMFVPEKITAEQYKAITGDDYTAPAA